MDSSLPDLLAALNDGRILTPDVFGSSDLDEIVDARESDPRFEAEWNRCYAALEQEWSEREIGAALEEMVDEIRELAFEVASANTDQHEIANHVSDDFELFARAIVLEFSDAFLDTLWESYDNGEIPSPVTIME